MPTLLPLLDLTQASSHHLCERSADWGKPTAPGVKDVYVNVYLTGHKNKYTGSSGTWLFIY